jgi:hypothetical protein
VVVVVCVTARAGRVELLGFRIAWVTAAAFQGRMASSQREAGLSAVVEAFALPRRDLMAITAR